jgi:hypothetical protein
MSLLVTILVANTFQWISSIIILSSNFKSGALILNFLEPPNKAMHSFTITCSLSRSNFGSRQVSDNCQTWEKKTKSYFLIPTINQLSKIGPLGNFSPFISSSFMIALQVHKHKHTHQNSLKWLIMCALTNSNKIISINPWSL